MNLLSLFSGCGGMDIGFEGGFNCLIKSINKHLHRDWIEVDGEKYVKLKRTRFSTFFANDIRPDAKAAWEMYFNKENDGTYCIESIVELVKKAKNGEYIFPNNVDLVTGGFPCQDFSVAGKRMGFDSQKSHLGTKVESPTEENRGKLYIWMKEVITLTKPKMFIAENVKGLTNLKDVKEIIEKDFSSACNGGYLVLPAKVLFAPNFGVPQSRERVIFFGFKKSALTSKALEELSKKTIPQEYDPYPSITHSNTDSSLPDFVSCKDAFVDLLEPDVTKDIAQQKYSKAKYMPKGEGHVEVKLDGISPTIRSEHHGNIEFRRLSLEHGGKNFEELQQGLKERRLTVRECARLQTFPDDYKFILQQTKFNKAVSASDAYKIIGNAVPCVMAYNIAMNLDAKWELYFGGNEK